MSTLCRTLYINSIKPVGKKNIQLPKITYSFVKNRVQYVDLEIKTEETKTLTHISNRRNNTNSIVEVNIESVDHLTYFEVDLSRDGTAVIENKE